MIQWMQGDCRQVLAALPERSVHCVVTSPPYWGLRDYGVHEQGGVGLEPTLAEWLANMVEVMRGVWRVLRDDGTLWLNMGDAYASSPASGGPSSPKLNGPQNATPSLPWKRPQGLKPKDLIGQPWRLAFALQDDGWYLRSDIIWHKPNPMPESVQDRPTKSHEYVFLLTKRPTYFYDAEAVREDAAYGYREWTGALQSGKCNGDGHRSSTGSTLGKNPMSGRNKRTVWSIPTAPLKSVSVYGTYRITSLNCPMHGCLACLAHALQCDEQQVVSDPVRSLGIGNRLEQGQAGVAYAIDRDQNVVADHSYAAIVHSIVIHKMGALLEQDVTSDDTQLSRIACIESLPHSCAMSGHMPVSKSAVDAFVNALGWNLSEQTLSHIFGIATFENPPQGCCCQYVGKVEKRQDHFASFPPALVEPCIQAGTSQHGCCAVCGAPWRRVVERSGEWRAQHERIGKHNGEIYRLNPGGGIAGPNTTRQSLTTGWEPGCSCDAARIPCTVLDPFGGAGTTALVADRLGRNAISIELNAEYMALAKGRVLDEAPLFHYAESSGDG